MRREPDLDELIGGEAAGPERDRLLHAHELLLEAGPPPELPPSLQKAPSFNKSGVVRLQHKRVVKRRALVLLAAALAVVAVFFAGYAARGGGSASAKGSHPVTSLALRGTSALPNARATLAVWKARDGNWPMTLSVSGLPKLANNGSYEVYLVRDGRPWGLCGTFRGAGSTKGVTVTLNAPYSLRTGDSWVVTRPTANDAEPGQTVLKPVAA
ncbi:MAG TPA: hypothetical protein VKB70_02095 [Gaiellaceae bacterium]|nr:hypothetical protein [Gaiellaceae bacterium]